MMGRTNTLPQACWAVYRFSMPSSSRRLLISHSSTVWRFMSASMALLRVRVRYPAVLMVSARAARAVCRSGMACAVWVSRTLAS